MKRIFWWGIGPWHKTGYGQMTEKFVKRIAGLGYEVAIGYMGRRGVDDQPETCHPDARTAVRSGEWEGLRITGPGPTEFGLPRPAAIRELFGGSNPDLVLVLKDAWVLNPRDYRPWNTAIWCNIDCQPMGVPDREFFAASGARPVAVSKFGVSVMREAGLDPLYVPHGIDTSAFTREPDKAAVREYLGLPADHFIVGINASNIGPRKGFGEAFAAFAQFHGKLQPKSLLLVHTVPEHHEGINLRNLAARHGITDCVVFGSHTNMRGEQMVSWYQALDVLLNCTWGEGFGLPIVEALACGIPVVGTECSAITEKIPAGAGWLVPGQPLWNDHHQADWVIPNVPRMTAMLAHAYAKKLVPAQQYAAAYDADFVTREYWKPALERLLP